MKGKLPSIMMVALALVMAFSLATTAFTMTTTTTVSAATDSWSRMDLPTTNYWQMAPNTDIWDLTAADDGTLFALVEDTSGPADIMAGGAAMAWDGLRWAVYPAYSDVSLFKSTDGGYTWELAWHMPSVETGAPIAVVPQPGYNDADAGNDIVFIATGGRNIDTIAANTWVGIGGNVYYSSAGSAATQFTRVTPANPGVALGGWITSMDVADCGCVSCPSSMMVAVGVSGQGTTGRGEGVYTWNRNGTGNWEDLQVSNSMVAPPSPGTLPAGNGLDCHAVKFAKWETEKGLIAVVNALGNPTGNPSPYDSGIFTCFYDGVDGFWGGDVDSPTNAGHLVGGAAATADAQSVVIAIGSDYSKQSGSRAFVGISDSTNADDVWNIRGLSTVTGPSTARTTGLVTATSGVDFVSDIVVPGAATAGVIYVGCEFPAGQAQVFKSANILAWPSYTPSYKPASGGWPVLVTQGDNLMVGTSENPGAAAPTRTKGGVSVMVEGVSGCVYNGIGLLDDIAVSEDIPGYTNPGVSAPKMAGNDWCLSEAVAMDTSKGYVEDGYIFVSTFSEWANVASGASPDSLNGSLSLWRLTGDNWERILYEGIQRPDTTLYLGKAMLTNGGISQFENDWTWWPRASLGFDADPFVYLLGGRFVPATSATQEILWYSPDKGDTWNPSTQMPIAAIQQPAPNNVGLSETGWWVLDNSTVFLGDINGRIYKTTDRGTSWTEGVSTATGLEITTIITSPVYSDGGEAGTDQAILVGTYDGNVSTGDQQSEIWISQDGCVEKDLENVGDEINTDSTMTGFHIGGTVVQFDPDWAQNGVVYASASGWMDRWELVGSGTGGANELIRTDYTDVGLYRTVIDLYDPAASTWEQLFGADDFNAAALAPKAYFNMLQPQYIERWVSLSGINFGPEGAVYCSYTIWDSSYNVVQGWTASGDPATPNMGFGRFTDGGVIRCLDGTAEDVEIVAVDDGLGHYDGIWLNTLASGNSNTVIGLTYDWQEWRFKLAFYTDTLAGEGPAPASPADGATGVGSVQADDTISAPISWNEKGSATKYEWQVSEDSGFTSPVSGTTSDTEVTVPGLKGSTKYYWRSRAIEPMTGSWNDAQSFTTAPAGDSGAPAIGSPAAGAKTDDSTPLLTWAAVTNADSYQVQVSDDPGFGSSSLVVDETLGAVEAYELDVELADGTYYWRVRASVNGDTTAWSSLGSFVVDTEDAGHAATPVWVWVLIIIGALLLIIVLVLILRTRRPV